MRYSAMLIGCSVTTIASAAAAGLSLQVLPQFTASFRSPPHYQRLLGTVILKRADADGPPNSAPARLRTPSPVGERRARVNAQTPRSESAQPSVGSRRQNDQRRSQSAHIPRQSAPQSPNPERAHPSTGNGHPNGQRRSQYARRPRQPTDTYAKGTLRGPGKLIKSHGTAGLEHTVAPGRTKYTDIYDSSKSIMKVQPTGQPPPDALQQTPSQRPAIVEGVGHEVSATVHAPIGGAGDIKIYNPESHLPQEKTVESGEIATLRGTGTGPGTARISASVSRAGEALVVVKNPPREPPQ